ncbi:MAG: septal ring lytic transglycosylase RlpA family protein [Desulfobacteraceae bacterium]|nr:MAG: septal ring lytic transglycosylase RlpA family protein [Desulfobacteraceae bacterium]
MKTPFLSVILSLISLACLSFLTGCSLLPTKTQPIAYYGKASYYGDKHQGKFTANGEIYDKNKLTCAHKDLPFETICRVTNLANGKNVVVRVNDRGPFIKGRIIDLSYQAMKTLDGLNAGVIDVRVEIIE